MLSNFFFCFFLLMEHRIADYLENVSFTYQFLGYISIESRGSINPKVVAKAVIAHHDCIQSFVSTYVKKNRERTT